MREHHRRACTQTLGSSPATDRAQTALSLSPGTNTLTGTGTAARLCTIARKSAGRRAGGHVNHVESPEDLPGRCQLIQGASVKICRATRRHSKSGATLDPVRDAAHPRHDRGSWRSPSPEPVTTTHSPCLRRPRFQRLGYNTSADPTPVTPPVKTPDQSQPQGFATDGTSDVLESNRSTRMRTRCIDAAGGTGALVGETGSTTSSTSAGSRYRLHITVSHRPGTKQ